MSRVQSGHHRASQRTRVTALLLVGLSVLAVGLGLLFGMPLAANAQTEPTPFPLYALPDPRLSTFSASNMLALAKDNRTLVAANMLNNTISVVLPAQGKLVAEIPVGNDPRSIALTSDGARAITTNRGDGTLSVVDLATQDVTTIPLNGVYPYGVVLGDDSTAYVSLEGSSQIAVVNIATGEVSQRITVPAAPAGLALWGDFLYVTHFWSGQVGLIYLPQMRVVATVNTGVDTGLSQAIELDVTRGIAYLPQTRSNAQNTHLTFDTTVFPIVNIMNLRSLTLQRESRITLDTADRPVNMPFAVALDRFRQSLYVANAGSDNVSVIDLNTGLARAHIDVGSNPRGILLNRDNSLLFVYNAFDGTLSVIETRTLAVTDTIPISDFSLPVDTILASQLFYGANDTRLSADNWISCANCHFDGESDGRVWQGFPDGPRNTPLLFGLLETAPYNWSATWDELADAETKIRTLQAGSGLIDSVTISPALGDPHAGLSLDLDVLASYLANLQGPTPVITADSVQVERGKTIFDQQGCAKCHVGTVGTDLQKHDVGTGKSDGEKQGTEFDTPSLRWLWLSAPYFHDGSAATLRDVFTLPGAHQLIGKLPAEDIDALIAYLLTLPQP
jgi:YVTN family beta-propeller protein